MDRLSDFLEVARNLKSVKRTGWVERGVSGPESVADHSCMMALMCMAMPADGRVNRDRAVGMALVHDLAEAETGDIIKKENWPVGGSMAAAEKADLERKALKNMLAGVERRTASEMLGLWEEYEEGVTAEAIFVRDIDVAERIMQAKSYHDKGNFSRSLEGFWDESNMGLIRNKSIKMLVMKVIGKGR